MTLFDPDAILDVLVAHDVRFVLIGGLAAAFHGYPGITQDLDVCYARDDENLEHLAAALRVMEASPRGVDEDVPFQLDYRTLKAGNAFTFQTIFGSFDCLGTPSGTDGFQDLLQVAEGYEIDGATILVAALADLERMKRAAGRAKDLIALEWIRAIRDETEER